MHTKGPWTWIIHDYSMASLVGPDEMIDVVLSVSPCGSCIEHNEKEWEWGRCSVPKIKDANLIATAPELLEALIGMAEHYQDIHGAPTWEEMLTTEAQEAIRKAKEE